MRKIRIRILKKDDWGSEKEYEGKDDLEVKEVKRVP